MACYRDKCVCRNIECRSGELAHGWHGDKTAQRVLHQRPKGAMSVQKRIRVPNTPDAAEASDSQSLRLSMRPSGARATERVNDFETVCLVEASSSGHAAFVVLMMAVAVVILRLPR